MVGLERLLIGRTLDGRYTVEELIGQGRGGLVYRARHAQTGVEVALKVLAAPRTPEARERFRRLVTGEIRAAAAIEHPNVGGVYCLAHDAELDLDFVTSELLRGQTLASVLSQRGKPPIALGLRLLGDTAEGLAAGHRAGLVHRDLRPASLYLVRGDGERQVRVKVAGFGVPQIVRRESLAAAAPEVGAYASPEMLAAGSLRLTPASDVFGLGVVGYELITGTLPFDEAARRALAEGRTVEAAPPADVAAAVPPQVVEAVLQALRCDPAARFADGAAFAAALQQPVRQVMVLGKITPAAQQAAPAAEQPSAPAEPPANAEPAAPPPTSAVTAAPALFVAAAGGVLADGAPAAETAELSADENSAEAQEPAAAGVVVPVAEAAPVNAAAARFEAPAADPAPAPASAPIVAPPPADLTRAPVAKAPPRRAGAATPDLELYYPPQAAKPPVVIPFVASAPPPVPPQPAAAPVETPSAAAVPLVLPPDASRTAAALVPSDAPSVVPMPIVAETPAFAPPVATPALTPMPGAARRRAAAASGGRFRGSAMAAGFVLGLLVLGSAAWVATRHGGKPAEPATVPAANQLAQGPAGPSATPATPAEPAVNTPAAAAVAADTASRTPAQRAADARKKEQDDERRRQDEEKVRQAQLLLQQQQLAQQARTAASQPVAQPVPAQPQPQQQVAIAQPQRPAPQTAAPPPAPAPARVEPAASAPSGNQVFDEDVVEQRPRLTNINELQRALQDRYPAQLQANRVSGRVMASFVVGADGRVDPSSIQIVNSPNPGFNAPTQSVLRRARFRPATVKGQAVRVQVTMPISWTLDQ